MRTAIIAAMVAVLGLTTAANAVDVTWNVNANGNWGTAGNWDLGVPTGADNAILGTVNTSHARVVTVDGNQTVGKLTIDSGFRYTLNSSGGGVLTLLSGDLTLTNGGVNYVDQRIQAALQLGDGVTPVTATWQMAAAAQPGAHDIGVVVAMAGTIVNVQGDGLIEFKGISSSFLGEYRLGTVGSTRKVSVLAANGLGAGKAVLLSGFDGVEFSTTASHDTTLQVDGSFIGVVDGQTATLNGKLTGSGSLTLSRIDGSSGAWRGTLLLNHTANDFSGDISNPYGRLQVDGGWTGAGNINIISNYSNSPRLLGFGTIGMAAGKEVTVMGSSPTGIAHLLPGDDNVIGTLAIGTGGNTNVVNMEHDSQLHIDLAGDTAGLSDLLAIEGQLVLKAGDANKELMLQLADNGLALNGVYTLVTADSVSGTFDEVYFNGSLVANPTLPGGVNGTHQLIYNADSIVLDGPGTAIPEPGTLLLLGTGLIGALGIIRRRKLG